MSAELLAHASRLGLICSEDPALRTCTHRGRALTSAAIRVRKRG